MKWTVIRAYLTGMPKTIEGDLEQACAEMQRLADAKRVRQDRPPIGPLHFEAHTDQVDAFFITKAGRSVRFMTIMAGE